MSDGVIIKAHRLDDGVIIVELHLLDHDGPTWSWYPSVHHGGDIDATVIEQQVRAHHAITQRR